jgi:hypothetical protein
MNRFLAATVNQINQHGVACVYSSKGAQVYNPATSKSTSTSVDASVKLYPKHIRTNQYNYPDLVGKQVIMFYLANSELTFTPKVGDSITYNSEKFLVNSLQSHAALGEICLYKLLAVKG